MEVLIGGAVVGAAAWLARQLSKLRHKKRNRRFLASAGAIEDAYGGGGLDAEGRLHMGTQPVLADRAPQYYEQPSPALLQAGMGIGALDHPASYAAIMAASDDVIAHRRGVSAPAAVYAQSHGQGQRGGQAWGPSGPYQQHYQAQGPIIEEIDSVQWQNREEYGRPVYPHPTAGPYGRPMLADARI